MAMKKTSTEVVDEEFVQGGESCDNVSPSYAEMYEEQKVRVEELESENQKMAKEKENIINQYDILAKKYERLFSLYANNLDFYLAGNYIKENK